MAFGKIFSYANNPRTTGILAVAKANGLDIQVVETDLTQPSSDLLSINKLGKVPAFVGEDGFTLHECIAIAIYVTSQNEKTTLLGKTKQDYASILKWMSFVNQEVLTPLAGWYIPLVGRGPYNKKSVEDNSKLTQKAFDVLEEHLLHNTYLVGERITLADIFSAGIISRGFEYFFDKQWRSENPNVTRWFETIVNQPIYSDVAQKLEFLETPKLTNVAPKKTEQQQPKKEKKEAKPAVAPAPAADEPAPEVKAKHPCEALGRPTFDLDEWKRQFSNNPIDVALKWFWENANFEEYSLWSVNYKYNDELTLTFMSSNLIGGFHNRLEGSRKYLFGCQSVWGVSRDSVIQGAFIARGQEYLPVFDVAPDVDSYEFVKLDPSKPEDRATLEKQWIAEGSVTVGDKEYPIDNRRVFK